MLQYDELELCGKVAQGQLAMQGKAAGVVVESSLLTCHSCMTSMNG